MATEGNTKACGLEEWVPIQTNNSSISISDLAVAVSNVPFGIFAFLSNLAIIVTVIKTPSLQRPSNILLCSLATADCLTAVTAHPIFVSWWILIQKAHESCSYLEELSTAFSASSTLMSGWSFVNIAIISCDRCYALSKPFAYRANVTKGGKYFCIYISGFMQRQRNVLGTSYQCRHHSLFLPPPPPPPPRPGKHKTLTCTLRSTRFFATSFCVE